MCAMWLFGVRVAFRMRWVVIGGIRLCPSPGSGCIEVAMVVFGVVVVGPSHTSLGRASVG